MGRYFRKDFSFLSYTRNEHPTLESRRIECFLEEMVSDTQLWKISHSFEMLTLSIMHYHLFPMGEENQVLGKSKIILD